MLRGRKIDRMREKLWREREVSDEKKLLGKFVFVGGFEGKRERERERLTARDGKTREGKDRESEREIVERKRG
jgi:hypothetical protein